MLKEAFLDKLLEAAYCKEWVNIYDLAFELMDSQDENFVQLRFWANQLVRDKLAAYHDEEQTTMKITNYGRYWMSLGGYFTYLKEEHEVKERHLREKELHQEKLLEARLKLTQYRLLGFWVALVVSALGLALSVFNLLMYLSIKK